MLQQSDAARSESLLHRAQQDITNRWQTYQQLAARHQDGADEQQERS